MLHYTAHWQSTKIIHLANTIMRRTNASASPWGWSNKSVSPVWGGPTQLCSRTHASVSPVRGAPESGQLAGPRPVCNQLHCGCAGGHPWDDRGEQVCWPAWATCPCRCPHRPYRAPESFAQMSLAEAVLRTCMNASKSGANNQAGRGSACLRQHRSEQQCFGYFPGADSEITTVQIMELMEPCIQVSHKCQKEHCTILTVLRPIVLKAKVRQCFSLGRCP